MELQECIKYSDHSNGLEEFYEKALRIALEAPEGVPFLEIGTREGGSALVLLKAIKDSRVSRPLITIDPYGSKPYILEKDEKHPELIPEGFKLIDIDHREDYYRGAALLLAEVCFREKLDHFHFHIESADFMKTFPEMKIWWEGKVIDQKFAFVYLDGEHNIAPVLNEIKWFLPKMINGGIIAIDDIEHLYDSGDDLLTRFIKESHVTPGINRLYYTVEGNSHGT